MENQKLDDYFGYTEAGSSLEGEVRAGITTFLTMAYILVVNPDMLSRQEWVYHSIRRCLLQQWQHLSVVQSWAFGRTNRMHWHQEWD